MRTIYHAIVHGVPIAGIGLMLAGLFGGPACRRYPQQTWSYSPIRTI
jgi:hypothetical protein